MIPSILPLRQHKALSVACSAKKAVKSGRKASSKKGMRIAIEGCCHGELDKIYETLQQLERQQEKKIDLLICCGDFQAVRNRDDLECLACPPKYRHMQSFHKYYSGAAVAPYPTLFIGGNHEASNYLWELYYGGWAAPNIYYLGHAGVIKFGGLRIGGLSGTFQSHHYQCGHFERPPYSTSTMRSAYHVRELEAYRLKQLKQPVDIMLSHDWPDRIAYHGDMAQLLKCKPFLKTDIERGDLGNPPAMQIMKELQPKFWFSAHHHVKYAALVQHKPSSPKANSKSQGKSTSFLALDKCLPGRRFLQVLDFSDSEARGPKEFSYDEEWLAVLRSTHDLLSLENKPKPLPGMGGFREEVTGEGLAWVRSALERAGSKSVPSNFQRTAPTHNPRQQRGRMPSKGLRNPQTLALLDMLELPYNLEAQEGPQEEEGSGALAGNPEEIDIDDDLLLEDSEVGEGLSDEEE